MIRCVGTPPPNISFVVGLGLATLHESRGFLGVITMTPGRESNCFLGGQRIHGQQDGEEPPNKERDGKPVNHLAGAGLRGMNVRSCFDRPHTRRSWTVFHNLEVGQVLIKREIPHVSAVLPVLLARRGKKPKTTMRTCTLRRRSPGPWPWDLICPENVGLVAAPFCETEVRVTYLSA